MAKKPLASPGYNNNLSVCCGVIAGWYEVLVELGISDSWKHPFYFKVSQGHIF